MVSQIAERENSYQTAFRTLQEQRKTDSARLAWFERLRESAMDRFEQVGFPSVKEEEWKYTNVAPVARTEFMPILRGDAETELSAEQVEQFVYPESKHSCLVIQNGIFRSALSSLGEVEKGVVALDLLEAIESDEYGEITRNYLARGADYNADGFTALNTALTTGGLFIQIPKGVILHRPLQLLFHAEPGEETPILLPRVLIVAEENSSGTVIENYVGAANRQYLTNTVVEVVVGDGARLEHYKVQRESHEAFHIATTTALLSRKSNYDATTINFGARLSRHNFVVTMNQEGAECWVDGLYVVGDEQHTDTHSLIDHRSAYCTSHQLYKGILDGKSRAVFNGKIFVRRGAQKTDAMQTNKNLLLSNESHVDTKPQLEIFADDVKCAHGAAVGQIDEDELFYLETRGIHPDLGRNLLTYGFAEEVIAKIKVESVKAELDETVLKRLNTRLEA